MGVKYNVKYKFKNCENKTNEEIKEMFNKKWLSIILILENNRLASLNKV